MIGTYKLAGLDARCEQAYLEFQGLSGGSISVRSCLTALERFQGANGYYDYQTIEVAVLEIERDWYVFEPYDESIQMRTNLYVG